jgi:outer membrane protein assembly factor BamB
MSRSSPFQLACVAVLLGAGVAAADNWPQWRGPTSDGVSKETGLPTQFGAAKNLAWLLPLPGMGGSTPVIWGDRIFLTSEDGNALVLMCVGTDGKERWKRRVGTATGKIRRDEGNGASASPSTDGKHVWAFVASGELVCFDLDGNEVWKFNTQERYGRFDIQFGMHSTPLLDGDRLYLQLIHSAGAWVVAIDKATGKDVWKVARKSDGHDECEHSYASPALWRNGKDAFLIAHGNDYATGHALDDGRELWRVGGLNPKDKYNRTLRFISTPVASADLIVIPSAKHGPVVGLKPNATGMVESGSPFEQWRRPKDTPDVSSPLIHDGLVYLCGEDGFLMCVDAKTGEEYYRQRMHPARYRASPVYADGYVYLTARDGTITVVKAGKKVVEVAVNKLPDEISASPVISGGRIYFRGFSTLFAVERNEK